MKISFKVGDLVKVSKASDVVYRISWLDGFKCAIQERKPDGTFYYTQYFDTDCLIKA